MRAIETLWPVGDRPVGSYLGFLQYLEAAQVSFVLRLNQGTHPKFQDSEGREPDYSICKKPIRHPSGIPSIHQLQTVNREVEN
jgi:hypothetical protein